MMVHYERRLEIVLQTLQIDKDDVLPCKVQ